MKIIYTIAGLYRPAGMERVLTEKVSRLAVAGHDITIVTTEQKGRSVAFPLPASVKTVDLGIGYEDDNGKLISKLIHHPCKVLVHRIRLSKLLKQLRPDVTISLFCHDERFLPSIKDGSKKVLEVHFSAFKRIQYGRKGLWGFLDRIRAKDDLKVVRRFDRFVVLTNEDKEYWGAPENAVVIPNPVPFKIDSPAALSEKRVAAVGRLAWQKGFDRLIEAWRKVSPEAPDWNLSIFGDGELRGALKKQAEGLPVIFHGNVADPEEIYRNSSIIALTSHYEGLPMVLLEAQEYGIPVVSFDCKCGPADIIENGRNGLLVQEGDIEGFAEKLLGLIRDHESLIAMGKAARAGAERWSAEKIMKQWTDLLENL